MSSISPINSLHFTAFNFWSEKNPVYQFKDRISDGFGKTTLNCRVGRKPLAIIFLDVDDVLLANRANPLLADLIETKVNALFTKKEGLNAGFTELEWRIAASYFFSLDAVANLENLIEKVNIVMEIAIVISSSWREDGTVEDLQKRVFSNYSFSKFIIDKTPDYNFGKNPTSLISQKKYGFEIDTRGRQIDYWLRENSQKLNIQSKVILDDTDDGISKHFPESFVQVEKGLLSQSDTEKAYQILTRPLPQSSANSNEEVAKTTTVVQKIFFSSIQSSKAIPESDLKTLQTHKRKTTG